MSSKIINNTFILRNPIIPGAMAGTFGIVGSLNFFELLERRSEIKSAMILHQASWAIIRGNRIEAEGKSPVRHSIYLTNSSKGVLVDGNTFFNSGEPVTIVKDSTALLKNNLHEEKKMKEIFLRDIMKLLPDNHRLRMMHAYARGDKFNRFSSDSKFCKEKNEMK